MKLLNRCILAAALFSVGVLSGCGDEEADSKAVYRQMGIEYMEQGDYASAVESFEAALGQGVGTIGADELDISYYKAAAQHAGGDIAAAMTTYNAILDYDEEAADAYYLRGCLYLKQGDTEAAKADFENAVKYNSGDYELYLNIYWNLVNAGAAEAGGEFLNQALAITGSEMKNLEYRGQIHYLQGEYDNAVAELKEAVEAGSTYANLYLARCYDAMGDFETAEGYLKTYIVAAPSDAAALNELGEIMLEKERYAEAILYFEQGLACDVIPNSRALMQNLVVAYEYHGDFDKAWELIQEYVTLFPDDAAAQREYVFLKNRQEKVESVDDTESTEPSDDTENTESSDDTESTESIDDTESTESVDDTENTESGDDMGDTVSAVASLADGNEADGNTGSTDSLIMNVSVR